MKRKIIAITITFCITLLLLSHLNFGAENQIFQTNQESAFPNPFNYVFLVKTRHGREKEFLDFVRGQWLPIIKNSDSVRHFTLYVCNQNTSVNFITDTTDIIERDFIIFLELEHHSLAGEFYAVIKNLRTKLAVLEQDQLIQHSFAKSMFPKIPIDDFFEKIDEIATIELLEFSK